MMRISLLVQSDGSRMAKNYFLFTNQVYTRKFGNTKEIEKTNKAMQKNNYKLSKSLEGHSSNVDSVSFSPDSNI